MTTFQGDYLGVVWEARESAQHVKVLDFFLHDVGGLGVFPVGAGVCGLGLQDDGHDGLGAEDGGYGPQD